MVRVWETVSSFPDDQRTHVGTRQQPGGFTCCLIVVDYKSHGYIYRIFTTLSRYHPFHIVVLDTIVAVEQSARANGMSCLSWKGPSENDRQIHTHLPRRRTSLPRYS